MAEKRELDRFDRENIKLGIGIDYTNEGYHGRVARIRELWRQGKGPGAFVDKFLTDCGYKGRGHWPPLILPDGTTNPAYEPFRLRVEERKEQAKLADARQRDLLKSKKKGKKA